MKNFIRYLIVILLINLGILIDQSQASQDILRQVFECKYSLIAYSSETGSATIELTIEQFHEIENITDCDKLQVTIIPIDGLEYFGNEAWEIEIDIDHPYKTEIEVNIPANDTSGFFVNLKCDKIDRNASNYLMATNDTVLFTKSNPLYHRPLQQYGTPEEEAEKRRIKYEEANKEYEERQKKLLAHQPKVTTGPTAPFTRADSLFYDSLTDGGKKIFRKMKYLELQGPSTNKWGESIWIDQENFGRDSGETYFRKLPTFTKEERREQSQRRRDIYWENNPPALYDLIIDLSNQEDYDYFKNKVDSLEKTEQDGFYRIICKKPLLKEFDDRKIDYRRTHKPTWIKSDSAKAERRKQKEMPKKIGKIKESSNNMNSLFFEGFEIVWPGNWIVGDEEPANGDDYWGDLYDWYVYSGYWSVWCAAVGDMPVGDYYDNNMFGYMDMNVGIDLSNYENIYLTYKILYDTESGYDELQRWESSDGFTWTQKESYSGYSGGWEEISIPINSSGTFYVSFVFESDYSNHLDFTGVYIDDIEITGDIKTQPNLTYDWPAGWSDPIVASSVMGTNYSNILYGDAPAYIDWAIDNDSDKDSPPFHVGLYLDNNLIGEWSYSTLWSYSNTYIEDVSQTISSGYHTLKLVVDNRNEVAESNENDNVYES